VETYGVPSYKEANPAFFATVTFPFLFGVMFGDIAHGLLILLLGLYLTLRHGQVSSEWGKLLLPHRYMILLMGFFATYCGFIYNDFMSISLNTFGSCYKVGETTPGQPIQRISN
jgi:V-type H+-transporting ATPase subunit a